MIPKPHYLGPEFSSRFQDRSVVEAYHLRVPYPDEVFAILADLITDEPHTVLDVGSGPGNIARSLVNLVDRVDAVDISLPMIEKGRSLPDGNHPNLNWIHGRVEDVDLHPPYALVTAGQSLHWMDWDIVFPRFHAVLTPKGYVTAVNANALPTPWSEELSKLIKRYSTNPYYQPIDLMKELETRGLYQHQGEKQTAPVPFTQSIDGYLESFHAMSSLSRDHMGEEMASAFDEQLRNVVSSFAKGELLEFQIVGSVTWGRP